MKGQGLTQKQERFILEYFRTGLARESAIAAGYTKNCAGSIASHTLALDYVQERLARLRKKAEDATVMGILERKQRLTEIARANIPDFTDETGGITVKKGMTNVGAVSEIITKTRLNRKSMEPVVITNLKLHSPIQAMDLLNKMDKVYGDQPISGNTYVFNFVVRNEQAKELANKILSGERLLPDGR